MLTRVRTGFVLLFAVCLFLALSHIPAVLVLCIGILSALAMMELAEPLGLKKWLMGAVGLVLGLLASQVSGVWMTVLLGLLFVGYLLTGWGMMACLPEKKTFRIWERLVILIAVPMFLGVLCRLRQGAMGLYTMTLPILTCAATDTFAYFVGSRFGKRSLAPYVSPKKSVEGAVGGSLLAVVLLMLLGWGMEWLGFAQVRMDLLVLYGLTASVVGQFGDLCLSAVKRVAGVKDFGNVLPGHGGVLDRMDSCLLALPYTFLFIGCFGGIFC